MQYLTSCFKILHNIFNYFFLNIQINAIFFMKDSNILILFFKFKSNYYKKLNVSLYYIIK